MKTLVPSQMTIDLHGLIWGDITHVFTDVPMSNEIAEELSNSIWARIEQALKEHDKEIKDLIDERVKQLHTEIRNHPDRKKGLVCKLSEIERFKRKLNNKI